MNHSNKKMSFWLCYFLALRSLNLPPEFQVPRKAVFEPTSGEQEAPEPPTETRHKPTEPTSSSRLPALLPPALPVSPKEKVTSPPPQQPQCSDMHQTPHAHQGEPSTVLCSHKGSNETFAKTQKLFEFSEFHDDLISIRIIIKRCIFGYKAYLLIHSAIFVVVVWNEIQLKKSCSIP